MTSSLIKLKHRPLLRNFLLFGFVAATIFIGSVLYWRHIRVNSIPDVGEPFDVEAYLAKFDVEENAYDVFREAIKMRTEALGHELYRKYRYQDDNVDLAIEDWSRANAETKNYLERSRHAMMKWREATTLEFGYECHPLEMHPLSILYVYGEATRFQELFLLEISRLQHEERVDETWPLIRDMYLLQKHYRTGGFVAYQGSVGMYGEVSTGFKELLGSEQFSIDDLREMKSELGKIHRSYPPVRDALRMDYFSPMNYHELTTIPALNWMSGETELLRRTQNLWFSNWLEDFEDPPAERPEHYSHDCNRTGTLKWSIIDEEVFDEQTDCGFGIYRTGFDPEIYVNAMHSLSSSWVVLTSGPQPYQQLFWDDKLFQKLNLTRIALHIYQREQGQFPDQLDALVPDYIEELPTDAELRGKPLNYEPGPNSFELSVGEPYREE